MRRARDRGRRMYERELVRAAYVIGEYPLLPPPPVEFADFYARRGKYFAGIGRVTTVEKPGGVSRMIRRETKSSLRGSKRHFSPARIPLYPFLLFILVSSSVYAVGRRERIPIFTIIKSRI